MAATFKALSELADFKAVPGDLPQDETDEGEDAGQQRDERPNDGRRAGGALMLRHDIHIHLPVSQEIAVYDAIFRSLRENLGA